MSWREQPREPKPLQRTGKSCTEGTLTMKQEAWEGTIQERDCEEQHSTCDGPFGKARGGDSSWTAAAISEITSEVSRCKPCVRTEVGQSGFEWNINTQCHKEHNDPNRSVRSSTSNLSACGEQSTSRNAHYACTGGKSKRGQTKCKVTTHGIDTISVSRSDMATNGCTQHLTCSLCRRR